MATSHPARWAALVLELPQAFEDELAGVLGGGTLGVEVAPAGAGASRLKVYAESHDQAAVLLARCAQELTVRGLAPEACAARVEAVEDLRWVERYQEGLRPFPLGERFLVIPDGRAREPQGRTAILLVPGRAFGTGEHETTRLCAEALERHVAPGSRWLDLGTGTGILSVVAVHCGASRVEARDLDEEAVAVAREVVAANRVGDRIGVTVGSAGELRGAGFDGVVANIAASYFLSSAHELHEVLRPGGLLVASGLLRTEAEGVAAALRARGLMVVEEGPAGEWVLLVARRPARGA